RLLLDPRRPDPALLQGAGAVGFLPLALRPRERAAAARQRRAVQIVALRAAREAAQDRGRVLRHAQRRRRAAVDRAHTDHAAARGAALGARRAAEAAAPYGSRWRFHPVSAPAARPSAAATPSDTSGFPASLEAGDGGSAGGGG